MFQQKKSTIETETIKNNTEMNTFLGVGTEFKGKIIFQGKLRIDGFLEGEIEGMDTLILGEAASVNGVCKVGQLVVSGRLRGEIYAKEKVVLKKSADVQGKINTPSIVIEEGAHFNGTCKMGSDFPKEEELQEKTEVNIVKL